MIKLSAGVFLLPLGLVLLLWIGSISPNTTTLSPSSYEDFLLRGFKPEIISQLGLKSEEFNLKFTSTELANSSAIVGGRLVRGYNAMKMVFEVVPKVPTGPARSASVMLGIGIPPHTGWSIVEKSKFL